VSSERGITARTSSLEQHRHHATQGNPIKVGQTSQPTSRESIGNSRNASTISIQHPEAYAIKGVSSKYPLDLGSIFTTIWKTMKSGSRNVNTTTTSQKHVAEPARNSDPARRTERRRTQKQEQGRREGNIRQHVTRRKKRTRRETRAGKKERGERREEETNHTTRL
jgi:hypothetical protein